MSAIAARPNTRLEPAVTGGDWRAASALRNFALASRCACVRPLNLIVRGRNQIRLCNESDKGEEPRQRPFV